MSLFILLFSFLPVQDSAEVLINRGYDKYLEENYEGAISDFNQALQLAPENAEIYYLRGVCRSNIGLKVAAIKDLNSAIHLNPQYAEAYYEKAYIYLSDQNAQKAIGVLNKVIQLNPKMAEAYISRGTAKCMLNDIQGANADWEKAKELGIDYTGMMICE